MENHGFNHLAFFIVLQASDVSPTVQLLTTVSVRAFLYIMNIAAAKKGEEQKDAWEEQLKQRVNISGRIYGRKTKITHNSFYRTFEAKSKTISVQFSSRQNRITMISSDKQ